MELSRMSAIYATGATGATTVLNGTIVDMDGFNSVLFIAFATATSTAQHLHMEMGTDTATMEDATGTAVVHALDTLYLDVYRPAKRYVRGVFTASGASSVYRSLVTIQYNAIVQPTTTPASTTGKRVYSPGSGTATGLATNTAT